MKRKSIYLYLVIICTGLLFINLKSQESPLAANQSQFLKNLEQFYKQTQRLNNVAKTYQTNRSTAKELQAQLIATRLSFKKIEFLLDYLQPQDVKDYLNGAPLPKTERNAPRLVVLEPKGLQSIEELVFSNNLTTSKKKLVKLAQDLEKNSFMIWRFQQKAQLQDRHVLEAIRLGIVRITALGLTGFDTPASANTLQENSVAFQALYKALKPYLQASADVNLASNINQLFIGGRAFLSQNQNFETFNRALFIRQYLDPLYGKVGALHSSLNIETMHEVVDGETSLKHQAQSMFSDDFLNPYFYTSLYQEIDNPALQKLGATLFFDPILSVNLQRSCASCHQPNLAFTDGYQTSLSLTKGENITRNAPTLINVIYSEKFFYDLRADKIDNQIEHVIFNEHEFGSNYKTIFKRLSESEEYLTLFENAFPNASGSKLNRYNFSAAISAYLLSLRSFNSPVDAYLRGEDAKLKPEVIAGFNLFMGKAACGTCHFAPTFAGLVPPFFEESESEVLGVLKTSAGKELDADKGRIASGRIADEAPFYERSFKTTTVRNVALTAPYFHNGAYTSLTEVVEFYNHGGAQGIGLTLPQQTLPGDSLGLTPNEQAALVAFMEALTDTSGLTHAPKKLPVFKDYPQWNKRPVGGAY